MSIIGNLSENGAFASKHVDKGNLVTVLFHLGNLFVGGETKYQHDLTSHSFGNLAKEIPFENGQVTIGCFDKILHRGELWSGIRSCINFNLKKKIWSIS